MQVARNTRYENLRGFVNGARAIPGLAAVAHKVNSDVVCARTLKGKAQKIAPVRMET